MTPVDKVAGPAIAVTGNNSVTSRVSGASAAQTRAVQGPAGKFRAPGLTLSPACGCACEITLL